MVQDFRFTSRNNCYIKAVPAIVEGDDDNDGLPGPGIVCGSNQSNYISAINGNDAISFS